MKLGEMLVRDGRLTDEQLQQAIEQQARSGGRLGTVMVEMGLIDLDILTVYLGLELGIPIATGATLDRAKRLAVRLLSPEQALRCRCVPLLIQDRQLIAAVDDPHDLESLDELTGITGYRVIPRVAPEIRIFYYIERYYGVPRPARFDVFGDTPRGSTRPNPAAADLPGPSLPGLPPISAERIPAPTPAPPLRAIPKPSAAEEPAAEPAPVEEIEGEGEEYEFLELDAENLLDDLKADDAATAKRVEPAGEVIVLGHDDRRRHEAPSYEPSTLEDAVEAMRNASQRTEIADALLSYATDTFDVAALCIVRDNMAFGWRGFGPDIDQDRIETLLVPLDAPSAFRSAMSDEDTCFIGAPVPCTIHSYLFKVLRCAPPPTAAVYAIAIGSRVVNLLYTHHAGDQEISEMDRDGLRQACAAASAAYVRLIAVSKKKRTRPQKSDEDQTDAAPPRRMVTINPTKKAKPKPEPDRVAEIVPGGADDSPRSGTISGAVTSTVAAQSAVGEADSSAERSATGGVSRGTERSAEPEPRSTHSTAKKSKKSKKARKKARKKSKGKRH